MGCTGNLILTLVTANMSSMIRFCFLSIYYQIHIHHTHTKNASSNKVKVIRGMSLLTSKQKKKLKYLLSSFLIHDSLEKQNSTFLV